MNCARAASLASVTAALACALACDHRSEVPQTPERIEASSPVTPSSAPHRAPSFDGGHVSGPSGGPSGAALTELGAPYRVTLVGRFAPEPGGGLRFAWSLATIRARFRGTRVAMRLRDEGTNFFSVTVDGAAFAPVGTRPKGDLWPLAGGLSAGEHEIEIVKRTEAHVGEAVFLGLEVDGGELLAPPPSRARRIELLGDSITTGYGNVGPRPDCLFRASTENASQSYGALVGAALGADVAIHAWSGKTIGEVTELWERTLPNRPDSTWVFSAWVPQVVVTNLGTNDFAIRDPGEAWWRRKHGLLVRKIRERYPGAFVLVMLGPILNDQYPEKKQKLTKARRYMDAFRSELEASGERNVGFLEVPTQRAADGYGCGFHPSVKTHERMATEVAKVIKERMGW